MISPEVQALVWAALALAESRSQAPARQRDCGHPYIFERCRGCIDHTDCWLDAERQQAVCDQARELQHIQVPGRSAERRRQTLMLALLRRGRYYWFDRGAGPEPDQANMCELLDLCERAFETSEPMALVLFAGETEPQAVPAASLRRLDEWGSE